MRSSILTGAVMNRFRQSGGDARKLASRARARLSGLWWRAKHATAILRHRLFVWRHDLSREDRIATHVTPIEKRALFAAAAQHGGVIVEIGSYLGASACFLAAGIRCCPWGGRLHCVDTWCNDAMSEGQRDTWDAFCCNTEKFADLIVAHRGRSVDVAATFDEQVDLLFIDGDHSYEGCHSDITAWLGKVRPGGLIYMHDVGWAEGVQRVIREELVHRMATFGTVGDNLWWGMVSPVHS